MMMSGVITFLLLSNLVSVAFSQTTAPGGGECQDGTYTHEGRQCCLCGAGLHLVEHCIANLQKAKCEPCPSETYMSHPNSERQCEPCTSCSQLNANLEDAESCTSGKDRKCRCKKDYYCDGGTETCTLCQPCTKCGAEGIKADCTAHNNTVCNGTPDEGKSKAGMVIAIIFGIGILLLAAAAAVLIWKKKCAGKRQRTPAPQNNGNALDVEMEPLRVADMDMQPYTSDIAALIGWKLMKDVASRSRMLPADIESCQLNHPNDSQEQTHQLLKNWVENQGRAAPNKLVQILQDMGKRATAESVVATLSQSR